MEYNQIFILVVEIIAGGIVGCLICLVIHYKTLQKELEKNLKNTKAELVHTQSQLKENPNDVTLNLYADILKDKIETIESSIEEVRRKIKGMRS